MEDKNLNVNLPVEKSHGDYPLFEGSTKKYPKNANSLVMSLIKENITAYEMLIQKGADTKVVVENSEDGFLTNIAGIIMKTHLNEAEKLKLLKMIQNLDVNFKIKQRYEDKTLLHIACEDNAVNIVQFLVDKGANVNALESKHNRTPLMETFNGGDIKLGMINAEKIEKILLSKGANKFLKDKEGHTYQYYKNIKAKEKYFIGTYIGESYRSMDDAIEISFLDEKTGELKNVVVGYNEDTGKYENEDLEIGKAYEVAYSEEYVEFYGKYNSTIYIFAK